MAGRTFLINIFLNLIFMVAAPLLLAQPMNGGSIAVLLSDSEAVYAAPASAFAGEMSSRFQVNTFNLQGDIKKNINLKAEIFETKPLLIYALGAKAAYMAKTWTKERQEIPVIFAMVLNWQRYNLLDGQANMTGIRANIAPGTQFINLTTFAPGTNRIGVIYSEHSKHLVAEAKNAALILGLELVAQPIGNSDDFKHTFKKMNDRIDAYWVLSDPVIYDMDNISWLARRCIKTSLVCLGQSKNIVEMGMVFAINTDVENIGVQAASMAKNILSGNQTPGEIGVMAPLGTNIEINLKTANRIGLSISQTALNMATSVFEK